MFSPIVTILERANAALTLYVGIDKILCQILQLDNFTNYQDIIILIRNVFVLYLSVN